MIKHHTASFSARISHWIDVADAPLLVLALISVVFYLLELRGIAAASSGTLQNILSLLNALFIADFILKIIFQRTSYLHSPWIVIDLLSCLPGIALLINLPALASLQFTRLFRVLRVLRGLGILRSLKFMPALAQLAEDREVKGRRFCIGLNIAVALYAAAFIAVFEMLRIDFASNDALFDLAEFYLVLGSLLATSLAIYIIHCKVNEASWNQLKTLLNIALPAQVAKHFLHHPEAYNERYRSPATVVFIDFVGFSLTAEKLGADIHSLATHLEKAMDTIVAKLVNQDLIIDKFIGDAVMAFRGGPLVSGDAAEHARRVVRGALDAASALDDLSDPYFKLIKIGGASDECLIGAFGTSTRLSYTVLGNGANLASRLEPASGQCGASALFCERTRNLCGEMDGVVWRRWGTVRVKGKTEPQAVWEPLDLARTGDTAFIAAYEKARMVFETKGSEQALPLFAAADAARSGGDGPSRVHRAWCERITMSPGEMVDTALEVMK